MGRMNTGRILMGGILAGIILNGLDYVLNEFVLVEEGRDMVQRLGLDPAVVEASATTWIVMNFAMGLLLVFTYAAMRPRFGPGPKTAVVSSVTIWIAVTAVLSGFASMGIFTTPAFMKHAALYLICTLIGGLVGAAVYKE